MAEEVHVTGKSGQAYTISFGTNAWCRLEDNTGRTAADALDELRGTNSSMRVLRQFVQAVLVVPKDPSLEQVGDIIDDLGGATWIRASFMATAAIVAPKPDAAERVAA